jgi:hypothetical protein
MPVNFQSNFVNTEQTNFNYDRNEIYNIGLKNKVKSKLYFNVFFLIQELRLKNEINYKNNNYVDESNLKKFKQSAVVTDNHYPSLVAKFVNSIIISF